MRILFSIVLVTLVARPIMDYYVVPSAKTYFVGADALYMAILTIIIMFTLVNSKRLKLLIPSLNKYFILWLVCLLISMYSSTNLINALRRWFVVLSFFAIFNYVTQYRNRRNLIKILAAISLSSVYPIGITCYNFIRSPSLKTSDGLTYLRVGSIFEGGFAFGIYLMIVALVTLGLYFVQRGKIKILIFVLFIFQLFFLLASSSRTAIFSFFIAALVLLSFTKRKKTIFIFFVAFVAIFLFFNFYYPDSTTRIKQGLRLSYYSPSHPYSTAGIRLMKYGRVFSLVSQRPFFGWGLANSREISLKFFYDVDLSSSLLVTVLEGGFVTLLVLALVLIKPLLDGLKSVKKLVAIEDRVLLSLSLAVCISGLLSSVGETTFLNQVIAVYYWSIIGVGYSLISMVNKRSKSS